MIFYEFEGFVADEKWAEENENRRILREKCRSIAMKSKAYNRRLQRQGFFYVKTVSDDTVSIGIMCRQPKFVEEHLYEYVDSVGLELKDTCLEETTFNTARNMLQCACRNGFIDDDDDVLEQFDLDKLDRRFGSCVDYCEFMFEEADRESIYKESARFLTGGTFAPELDRIYTGGRTDKFYGHPVHYMIQTDDEDTRIEISRMLFQALYENNRLQSRRFSSVDFRPGERFSSSAYDALYKSSAGGALVVNYLAGDDTEDNYASGSRETIEILCKMMMRYWNQVLTVFCFPRECTKSRDLFYENLGGASFVELKEDYVSGDQAKAFLKMLAADHEVSADDTLFHGLEKENEYLAPDLHKIFDEWFSNELKNGIYPQYKTISAARQEVIKAVPKGSAYDELMEMIGLNEAKKVIVQALNYHKAQKVFAEKGMLADRPSMHMVFTGNPGTAKTSVARLFARIMKENDLLSKGRLIEVGRGDLVGKYVGWTAPAIQKKFREAQGSVLFIDEAYSLVDDRDGSFGDEAINTIVQEMENHRDDVVVIFAGYPDKMEHFLQKNPGLRSRIAYHVPFADYNTSELCGIANLLAKQKGITLSEEALIRLEGIFDTARKELDFGNGRFVRNVLEKAKMAQATRLLAMDIDKVNAADVTTILGEDIEEVPVCRKAVKRKIGFCVD